MKTYNEFLNESTVKEDEYNLAAAKVGAKSKGAYRNLTFGYDVSDGIKAAVHVSKSRTSNKKTSLFVNVGYSSYFKQGATSSGFNNIEALVKELDGVKAAIKGMDAAAASTYLTKSGFKKL